MPFDNHGFLGKQSTAIIEGIKRRYVDYFSLCHELNSYAENSKSKFEVHNKVGQEVIAACLYIKILEGFQATVLLSERGLNSEVKVMIRSILEALFLLRVCCKDEGFIPTFVLTDELKRLKIMNISHQYSEGLFSALREYATDEIRNELKTRIDEKNINDLHISELARNAEMAGDYDTVFRYCSEYVHSSPRSLEKYVKIDINGNISELLHAPDEEDMELNLLTIADYLIKALHCMFILFKIDNNNDLQEFNNNIARLYEKAHLI
jgi:hypothetical protein